MKTLQEAEIISDDHRVLARVSLLDITEHQVKTLVPRNDSGAPVTFAGNEIFNLVYCDLEHIHFYRVRFKEWADANGKPCYCYDVLSAKGIVNNRKEDRKNVEYQAVISNFRQIGIVTILDISPSGMKIESKDSIDSEYIELFYDELNVSKRAKGEIIWAKSEPGSTHHYYGLNLSFR